MFQLTADLRKSSSASSKPPALTKQMPWPPRYTPPRASHCCSTACCSALVEPVQVPAAYVPPADVQIANPLAEQPASCGPL